MKNFLDLLFLSIALAMDCFAVSVISGMILKGKVWKVILQVSFLFGFFQAFMPFAGWMGTRYFMKYIEAYDHWIAFGLLLLLGLRMIRDSFLPEKEKKFNPRNFKTQLLLAVATSIDAMAVGISFTCMGYHSFSSMVLPLTMIGTVSFFFSITGHLLGIRFGSSLNCRLRPELAGGIILILIGVKILVHDLAA